MRGGELLWSPVVSSLCALPAGSALCLSGARALSCVWRRLPAPPQFGKLCCQQLDIPPPFVAGRVLRKTQLQYNIELNSSIQCSTYTHHITHIHKMQRTIYTVFQTMVSLGKCLTLIFCNNYNNGYLCSMTNM